MTLECPEPVMVEASNVCELYEMARPSPQPDINVSFDEATNFMIGLVAPYPECELKDLSEMIADIYLENSRRFIPHPPIEDIQVTRE